MGVHVVVTVVVAVRSVCSSAELLQLAIYPCDLLPRLDELELGG